MSALSRSEARAEAESIVFVRTAVAWPHSFLNQGHDTSRLRLWFSRFVLLSLCFNITLFINIIHSKPLITFN